LDNFRFQIDLK